MGFLLKRGELNLLLKRRNDWLIIIRVLKLRVNLFRISNLRFFNILKSVSRIKYNNDAKFENK